jgi:toxin HigB-1
VIRTFKSKPLADLWSTGHSAKIDQQMHRRILIRLDRLNVVASPSEMNVPGFNFHSLRGFDPVRYSVHVNGPWCLTFESATAMHGGSRLRAVPLRNRNEGIRCQTEPAPLPYASRRIAA